MNISWLERVSSKDVVILSRQLSTLFEAQVSALRIFRLLAAETENVVLAKKLVIISDDLQAGSQISAALAKHPKVFSEFYVSMVKAGEESGKLDETFNYLADYLDRTYELMSKAKGALIYPAFVIMTFITVMILMFHS
jgi:type IV pilus assembly protein PilC